MKTLWLLALLNIASIAHADTLTFNTESYPPYAFRDGATLRGITIEQVDLVMKDSGIDYKIGMMPWARAMALAETQPLQCMIGAARTSEREPRFKWVSPLLIDRNLLVTRLGSGVKARTTEEAVVYSIGTQREDYTEALLRRLGFDKIDLSSDFNLTLNKLLGGRIQMMPMSENVYEKLKKDGTAIEAVMMLTQQAIGIACSKDVSDETIDKMQASLDRLIADGTQDAIFARYGFPSNR